MTSYLAEWAKTARIGIRSRYSTTRLKGPGSLATLLRLLRDNPLVTYTQGAKLQSDLKEIARHLSGIGKK